MSIVAPRPDTSDMVSVHKVFREALDAAPGLIGSVVAGDTERAGLVQSYYANVLAFLHVHHEGEDELLWPKLLERCPQDAELVDSISSQHEDVHASLSAAEDRLAAWAKSPDADHGAQLIMALRTLNVELATHLDEEERVILPMATEHLSVQEWGEFPAHGMQHFAGDKFWLVLGLLQEAMTPAQREAMLAHMPPPALEYWANVGRPQFESFIAELRR